MIALVKASPAKPSASKRERNKASNRTAILRAARSVFAEMGYGAASVRDIIRRTELAAGTFYNYFRDKDQIFRAVVEELAGELRQRHAAGRRQTTTAHDFVEATFRDYFTFIAGDPELTALARRSTGAVRTLLDQPEIAPLFQDLLSDVQAAIARGTLPPMDAHYFATALAGIAFEVSISMVGREPIDPEGATRFATQLVVGGLTGLPRPAKA